MKKKPTRSAKTTKAAAASRRPVKRTKIKTQTPSGPAAKRKTAAKKKAAPKAVRLVAVPRAARARKAAPVVPPTPPAPVPASVPAAPPALTEAFERLASPPPKLSELVRQAQAAQPLPALPPEPSPALPTAASAGAPASRPFSIPSILFEGDERTQPVLPGLVEKYAVAPTPTPEPPKPEVSELPEAYGTGKVYLTARDPHCLYAHWDLSEAQQRRYSGFAHHLALRVYQQHPNGEPAAETPVEPGAHHGFVRVGQAGTSYVAQLGCYLPGGDWLALAVSEPAATPPETVAEDKTVRWATVEPLVSAPQGQAAPPEAPAFAAPAAPAPDTRYAPPELAPVMPAPESREVAPPEVKPFAAAAPDAGTSRPHPEPARTALPPTFTPSQERLLVEMIEVALGQPRTIGSVEIVELTQKRLRREVSVPGAGLGIPAPLPLGGPASLPAAVPVELQPLGISSAPRAAAPERARQFWFNLNVEVVVYGATEPDARVTLGGLPLRLRPDGTFSCRFSLPDGRYDLPAIAISKDNDTRRAELSLGRRTEYHGEVGVHPQDKALRPPTPEHVQAAQT